MYQQFNLIHKRKLVMATCLHWSFKLRQGIMMTATFTCNGWVHLVPRGTKSSAQIKIPQHTTVVSVQQHSVWLLLKNATKAIKTQSVPTKASGKSPQMHSFSPAHVSFLSSGPCFIASCHKKLYSNLLVDPTTPYNETCPLVTSNAWTASETRFCCNLDSYISPRILSRLTPWRAS